MKFLILFLFCGVLCEFPVPTVLPVLEPETLTDLPREAIKDFEDVTVRIRQNDVESELAEEDAVALKGDENISTTTVHFTEAACTGEHMEWNSCGPRCYQTCAFQPRGVRRARAVCEPSSVTTGCYPGCFCKSGYVRINDKCVMPTDCPSK